MIMAAIFLATTNKILIDAIFKPIRDKFTDHDFFWLFYVSLVTGATIGWFSQGNLFTEFIPNPIFGRILTSLFIGGGASLINDLLGNINTAIRSVSVNNWSQAAAADVTAEKTGLDLNKALANEPLFMADTLSVKEIDEMTDEEFSQRLADVLNKIQP